jgi:hypothetical protein
MIKKNKRIVFIVMAFCCLVWAACKEQQVSPCEQPTQASLYLQCFHYAVDTSTIPVDTVLPYAVFVSLGQPAQAYVYGVVDGIVAGSATFSISLSPFADSCKWAMIADSLSLRPGARGIMDTLTFYYQRQLNFLSNACGYTYFYNLDTVITTKHNIDSVIIENTSVTLNANGTEQLAVYIHRNF